MSSTPMIKVYSKFKSSTDLPGKNDMNRIGLVAIGLSASGKNSPQF